jgi:hypothetical protein
MTQRIGLPGTQAQPKRIAVSWICFLTALAAVAVFELLRGPWPMVDAAMFTIFGVLYSLQALRPGLLPARLFLPAWFGLTNRTVPDSWAYGSRFDRMSRAGAALLAFYVAVTTPGVAALFHLGT